ncbi:MAG: undecaprenyl/decaprenyl-phosphate alpha-N-acetylglucosaminyl 1-phosphate transferase [Bacteroidaceae bacterium]|nr:undecaprenyl/decaprenyl-phosphate alpha-N-acetylglucosaminyl 1-phosphate transferase [Bacteroidaceae bacterium]
MTINYVYIILAFAISLTFSLVCTPLIVKICNTRGIYDLPNTRKMHKQAIPRLGGTLFMPSLGVGVAITLLVMYQGINKNFEICVSNIIMVVGALLIYLIGILDDLKGLKATHKFIIQSIAALLFPLCNLMISNLHGLFGVHEIPLWISYPLTVFVILLIVNAINLIDGIDGLASSIAFLILGSFAYLYYKLDAYLFSLISISLAGATLAFFFFNFYGKVGRLKTFMGDSGSLFLGYVIAYLAIKYQMSNETGGFPYREESLLISFTLVFLPSIDVIRVALQRKFNGKSMFEADKTHIHHRIMQMGLDMHQTLAVILLLFLAICLINYGLYVYGIQVTYIILIDAFVYSIFIYSTSRLTFLQQN